MEYYLKITVPRNVAIFGPKRVARIPPRNMPAMFPTVATPLTHTASMFRMDVSSVLFFK